MKEKRTEQGQKSKQVYIDSYKREHYDRITITAPKGTKERWKEQAEARDMSVSQLAIKAIDAYTTE